MMANGASDPMEIFDNEMAAYREQEEVRLIGFLSKKYSIPVLFLPKVDPSALQMVQESESREAKMAVYKRLKGVLDIIIHEPRNKKLAEILKRLEERGFSHNLHLTTTKNLETVWKFYKDIVATSRTIPGKITIENEDLKGVVMKVRNLQDAKRAINEMVNNTAGRRTSKSIEYLLYPAVSLGISDIHLETTRTGGVVRYRLDGILVDIVEFDKQAFKKLLTRMKLTAQMKLTSKGAQDGAFVVEFPDRTISVRASVIPETEGGSFVLRLLDPKNVIHSIENLGLHKQVLDIFQKNVAKPNGLVLTTGPTGSGKTTTLYSFLEMIKDPDIKIITLEDPIEYRLEGIVQTQIEKNYSFSSGLRAVLRQDPDVLLVGEIRDEEVAEIAVQASLTGHLVFSTLHTNDAIGAIYRMTQLGINPQLLSRSINIVIAQRLVRTLCPHCNEKHVLTEGERKNVQKRIDRLPTRYREEEDLSIEGIRKPSEASKNCEHCLDGYKGRIGIFEVFEVTAEIEDIFRKDAGFDELIAAVHKQDTPFLEDDGIWKALKGKTSLAELLRVIGVQV